MKLDDQKCSVYFASFTWNRKRPTWRNIPTPSIRHMSPVTSSICHFLMWQISNLCFFDTNETKRLLSSIFSCSKQQKDLRIIRFKSSPQTFHDTTEVLCLRAISMLSLWQTAQSLWQTATMYWIPRILNFGVTNSPAKVYFLNFDGKIFTFDRQKLVFRVSCSF